MNCVELTVVHADAALDTLICIDNMGLSDCTCDSACRTISCAESTALTLVRNDLISDKRLTYSSSTCLVIDMVDILLLKELHCREYRVRSCLTESAK